MDEEGNLFFATYIVWCLEEFFLIFLFDLQTFGVHFRDERDASIQIFDKVLLLTFAEDERKINDVNFLFHLAAASIIIACKLSDGNSHVSEVGIYNQHCHLLPLLIVLIITSIFSGLLFRTIKCASSAKFRARNTRHFSMQYFNSMHPNQLRPLLDEDQPCRRECWPSYGHSRYLAIWVLGRSYIESISFIHTLNFLVTAPFIHTYSNGHNFCKIRFLKAIDHEYLYKRCLYEVFYVK